MNPTDMTGAYVTQRRVEMQARADDYRRTTSGRTSQQPRSTAVNDWLTRGRQFATVEIRPIGVGDESLIRDGFAKLSAQSRSSRFVYAKAVLTENELHYLTHVDHHDHEALVAVRRTNGAGLGVARYVRDNDNPTSAEV